MKQSYQTIIVSDLHLGKPKAQVEKLLDFLSNIKTKKLIINGDGIDFWQLSLLSKWTDKESEVVNKVVALMDEGVEVIYIKGNHDAFVRHLHHLHLHRMNIIDDYIYTAGNGKKYYLFHGEQFDFVNNFVSRLTNMLYTLIYLAEKVINPHMKKIGYIPVSEKLKMRFKRNFFPKKSLHRKAMKVMKEKGCDGIILGHFHMPDHVILKEGEYFNAGDRVAHCTAIVEDESGNLKLIHYQEK